MVERELSVKGRVVRFHLPPFQNLGIFIQLLLPVSFGRDPKPVGLF